MSSELRPAPRAATPSEKLSAYARLMRLDRPIGSLLLLWPTLWALWIAGEGRPSPHVFIVFALGVVVMRSAGCVINDYADRKVDGHVARTRARPLASGEIQPREALILFVALMAMAFALVVTLGAELVKLSLIGAFLAASYPFQKRFTNLPQFYLGAAFGWGIPMAFAAERGEIPLIAWLLFAANAAWVVAYDTYYAMTDREDDLKIGVHSTAILFGRLDRSMVALFQAIALVLLAVVGQLAALGAWFYVGLAFAAATALYQRFITRERDPARCFDAFLNNSWFGAAVFCGILLHYTFALS